MTGTLTATAAVLAAGATAASAANAPVSQADARFLGGSALGIPLTDIVDVRAAVAKNTAGGHVVTDAHPLSVTALNAVNVDIGPVNLLGGNGVLDLGAVGQFARARPDSSSVAASGAITNAGAIAVGGTNGVPAANASLDLSDLIGGGLVGLVTDLRLEVGALSARATQSKGGAQAGRYQIADLELRLGSPLLAGILDDLTDTLAGLEPTVSGLPAILAGLGLVDPVGALPDLTNRVALLQPVTSADGALELDLENGTVVVDLEKVLDALDLDLNHLPANTSLVPYIADALTTGLPGLIDEVLDDLTSDLTSQFNPLMTQVGAVPLLNVLLGAAVDAVVDPILDVVTDAAAGVSAGLDESLADVVDDIVSLTANVQGTSGGTFTQRALRLAVLPGSDPAAVVNLASASVGPNTRLAALPPPFISKPEFGSLTADTTPPISGTGKAGLKVTVVEGATVICTAKVKANKTWLCTPTAPMAQGMHRITATQSDATRTSAPSAPDRFVIYTPPNGSDDPLPETGAGAAVPTAATGLALLLGGLGLMTVPRTAGRHRTRPEARGGRHARR